VSHQQKYLGSLDFAYCQPAQEHATQCLAVESTRTWKQLFHLHNVEDFFSTTLFVSFAILYKLAVRCHVHMPRSFTCRLSEE